MEHLHYPSKAGEHRQSPSDSDRKLVLNSPSFEKAKNLYPISSSNNSNVRDFLLLHISNTMCKSPTHTFLADLPKCEHHLHLEGCLSPSLLFTLASKNNITLPSPSEDVSYTSPATLTERYSHFTNLDDFLAYYYRGIAVVVHQEDLHGNISPLQPRTEFVMRRFSSTRRVTRKEELILMLWYVASTLQEYGRKKSWE